MNINSIQAVTLRIAEIQQEIQREIDDERNEINIEQKQQDIDEHRIQYLKIKTCALNLLQSMFMNVMNSIGQQSPDYGWEQSLNYVKQELLKKLRLERHKLQRLPSNERKQLINELKQFINKLQQVLKDFLTTLDNKNQVCLNKLKRILAELVCLNKWLNRHKPMCTPPQEPVYIAPKPAPKKGQKQRKRQVQKKSQPM